MLELPSDFPPSNPSVYDQNEFIRILHAFCNECVFKENDLSSLKKYLDSSNNLFTYGPFFSQFIKNNTRIKDTLTQKKDLWIKGIKSFVTAFILGPQYHIASTEEQTADHFASLVRVLLAGNQTVQNWSKKNAIATMKKQLLKKLVALGVSESIMDMKLAAQASRSDLATSLGSALAGASDFQTFSFDDLFADATRAKIPNPSAPAARSNTASETKTQLMSQRLQALELSAHADSAAIAVAPMATYSTTSNVNVTTSSSGSPFVPARTQQIQEKMLAVNPTSARNLQDLDQRRKELVEIISRLNVEVEAAQQIAITKDVSNVHAYANRCGTRARAYFDAFNALINLNLVVCLDNVCLDNNMSDAIRAAAGTNKVTAARALQIFQTIQNNENKVNAETGIVPEILLRATWCLVKDPTLEKFDAFLLPGEVPRLLAENISAGGGCIAGIIIRLEPLFAKLVRGKLERELHLLDKEINKKTRRIAL